MILAILLVASFLRLYNLGVNPPSLYWDEAALAYDAYSLWKTGKDFHGNPWPIVAFESFGDYKPSGYFYVLAPFVGIFGYENWVVRLPSALAGIATVYLMYLLASFVGDKKLGLLVAGILAITPWHIFISRVGFEVNLGLMWLTLGLWLIVKAKMRSFWIFAAVIPLVLAMYTYHGYRIIAPLAASVTGIWFLPIRKLIKLKWLYGSILLAIFLLLPIIFNLKNPEVRHRFDEVNYLAISPAVSTTNQLREKYNNSWWARIVFHRYWFWGAELVGNGLRHFSPAFLFVHGDGNTRHQNPHFGLLYWWMLPFLLISFYSLRDEKLKRLWIWAIFLLIISAIPAALSFPTPHALRTLPSVLGWSMLTGLGMYVVVKFPLFLLLKNFVFSLAVLGLSASLIFYWKDLQISYLKQYSDSWQYGYRQAIEFVTGNAKPEENIYLTRKYGRPSIYVLLYAGINPKLAQQLPDNTPKDQSELLSVYQWDFVYNREKDYDWIINETIVNDGKYEHKKTINDMNGLAIFYIYRKSI